MSFPPGVYEWVTFQMKPGGPALWGESFQAAINAHINTGYTKLIGVFHTEYGLLNTGTSTAHFLIKIWEWQLGEKGWEKWEKPLSWLTIGWLDKKKVGMDHRSPVNSP